MPRALPTAVIVVASAAVGVGLGYWLNQARIDGLETDLALLRSDLAQARRDSGDWRQVAVTERERKEVAEEEAGRLRALLDGGTATRPPPAPDTTNGGTTNGGTAEVDPPVALEPHLWDGKRLRIEIERLALTGRRMPQSPLVAACAEAVGVQGDEARKLITDILATDGLSENVRVAAVLILEEIGDAAAVQSLVDAWPGPDNMMFRRLSLRAMTTLDGDVQVPTMLAVYRDPTADPRLRMGALNGLAVRGHREAIALLPERSSDDDGARARRAMAVENVHAFVRDGNYERQDLLESFHAVLRTADGEGQLRLAMLAVEGYWDVRSLEVLDAMAATEGLPQDLRDRAKRLAEALRAGKSRPTSAGMARGAWARGVEEPEDE